MPNGSGVGVIFSADPGIGGAIYHTGTLAEIRRSCFRECRIADYANAIYFKSKGGCSLSDSTLFNCRSDSDDASSDGGIYNDANQALSMADLNFSSCVVPSDYYGAAGLWTSNGGTWTMSRCTVVGCSGRSAVDSASTKSGKWNTPTFTAILAPRRTALSRE
jgi:hypothetical protein